MNIHDMHIEVRQGTQNIASNNRRKLLKEEIDWILNKNQERFIQSRVKPRLDGSGGFEVDQMNADSIRTLLKTKEITAEQYDGYCSVYLPADYMHLIRDESKTEKLCGTVAESSSVSEQVRIFKLPVAVGNGASPVKYFTEVIFSINTDTYIFADILTAKDIQFSGLSSSKEKYLIIDFWLDYLRNVLSKEVYWEQYRDIYQQDCFISPSAQVGAAASAIVDGNMGSASLKNFTNTVYENVGSYKANRLSNSEIIGTMQQTAFQKSSYLSPVSELEGRWLKIYTDSSFIVTKVKLVYVKKPRRMSLDLGLDCELAENFHQALCDLTVEYIKTMYQDPDWERKLQDNITRQPNT